MRHAIPSLHPSIRLTCLSSTATSLSEESLGAKRERRLAPPLRASLVDFQGSPPALTCPADMDFSACSPGRASVMTPVGVETGRFPAFSSSSNYGFRKGGRCMSVSNTWAWSSRRLHRQYPDTIVCLFLILSSTMDGSTRGRISRYHSKLGSTYSDIRAW